MLKKDCVILNSLGKHFAYEVAVGMNGATWLRAASPIESIVIRNAILNAQVRNRAIPKYCMVFFRKKYTIFSVILFCHSFQRKLLFFKFNHASLLFLLQFFRLAGHSYCFSKPSFIYNIRILYFTLNTLHLHSCLMIWIRKPW